MYSFKNDYSEGAHPALLQAIVESNMQQEEGYGRGHPVVKGKNSKSRYRHSFFDGRHANESYSHFRLLKTPSRRDCTAHWTYFCQ